MLEPRPAEERSARRRRTLRWLGRGYLTYHALVVVVLVVLFFVDARPGYWRTPEAVGELVLMALLAPLFIPALVVSGGPHNGGGGVLLVAALPVLLLTLVAAGSGVWLAASRFRRGRRAGFSMLVLVLACQGQGDSHAHALCSTESMAILAATDLVQGRRFGTDYVVARAYGRDSGDRWNI